jgi:hypothetical protein
MPADRPPGIRATMPPRRVCRVIQSQDAALNFSDAGWRPTRARYAGPTTSRPDAVFSTMSSVP